MDHIGLTVVRVTVPIGPARCRHGPLRVYLVVKSQYAKIIGQRNRNVGCETGGVEPVARRKVIGSRHSPQDSQYGRVRADAERIEILWIVGCYRPGGILEPQISGLEAVGRHEPGELAGSRLPPGFVVEKEEYLVFPYRSAYGPSKSVVGSSRPWQAQAVIRPRVRIERCVLMVLVQRSVILIRAALSDQLDLRAG